MSISQQQVLEALRPVEDPELRRSIVDLGMVADIVLEGSKVVVHIDLTIAGCPLKAEISQRVNQAVMALDGVQEVAIEFGVMSDQQRSDLRKKLQGDQGAQGQHEHGKSANITFSDPDNKTRILLVASGKGGVGKSSVTTNLSVALAARGKKVAVIDADVWGFSIPRMLGVEHPPVVIDNMVVPPEAYGVRCISMGFFVEEDRPVIWRGPMMHKALEQFLTDVYWDEPDFLVVDLPPGTGDIPLSLAQFLPRSEMLLVTTPQPAAQRVAQRAAYMAREVRIQIAGIIENMSWFTGDDGKRYELFGSGGGQELSDELQVPLLAKVPLLSALREGSDYGKPIAADSASEAGMVFAELAAKVDQELTPSKVFRSELKIAQS